MKRKITLGVILLLMVSFICGCTPKAKTIFCQGLGGQLFEIKYSVANNTYDGVTRSFSVKDTDTFIKYLTNRSDYESKMEMVDTEQEVFIFEKNSQKFFCLNEGNDNFKLSACWYLTDTDDYGICLFAFPPISFMLYRYDIESPMIINTEQSWEYFADFYETIENSVIDPINHTIEIELYQISSKNSFGKVLLEFKGKSISYKLIISGEKL